MTKQATLDAKTKVHIGGLPFQFDDNADAAVQIPDVIHLIPIGQWQHDLYGPITITAQDIREFAQNFNQNIRKGVFITAGHEGMLELPAVGWITKVEARDTGLWGTVEWNDLGKETLSDKQYKFFSPEFYRDYEDPQTHDIYRNVLTGGALTKQPYFKELEAVVFSEPKLKKFNNNENQNMDLQALLAKKLEELTSEEQAFIKEHKAELTPEQLTSHASIVDEPAPEPEETEEQKKAREEKEQGDRNEAAGLNRDGSQKVDASEKVMISAGELALLRKAANEGKQALSDMKKAKLDRAVEQLVFSESNKTGKFLPKGKDALRAFIETLNDEQHSKFTALMAHVSASQQFNEIGSGGTELGTAQAELETKVNAKMEAAEKAGKPMKYSDALKSVLSESEAAGEGLEKRYDESLPAARKGKQE